jgi:hypothetical protein
MRATEKRIQSDACAPSDVTHSESSGMLPACSFRWWEPVRRSSDSSARSPPRSGSPIGVYSVSAFYERAPPRAGLVLDYSELKREIEITV